MLELSWRGAKTVPLGSSGHERKFLQDGDMVKMTNEDDNDDEEVKGE